MPHKTEHLREEWKFFDDIAAIFWTFHSCLRFSLVFLLLFCAFLFQCLTNLLFSSSSPRSFHICYFAYLWASKLCAMRSVCMSVHTYCAFFLIFFCLLKCALEGSLIFFWLLQPKFHKEAKIKFLLITWMHMRGKEDFL